MGDPNTLIFMKDECGFGGYNCALGIMVFPNRDNLSNI